MGKRVGVSAEPDVSCVQRGAAQESRPRQHPVLIGHAAPLTPY